MKVKKIILVLMVVNLLVYGLFSNPMTGESAILSKVGTAGAKKVAKEVIKDSAVQMAMDIVFNYEMNDIMKNGYRVDDGYTPICMEKVGDKCSKPMQAKVPSTKAEKKALADKVETVLDRKANMSGWKKFLDWFIPIFLLGSVGAWLESLFDDDTESLFDEVAKEALDESGFILPIAEKEGVIIRDNNDVPFPSPSLTDWQNGVPVVLSDSAPISFEMDFSNKPSHEQVISFTGTLPYVNTYISIDFASNKDTDYMRAVNLETLDGYGFLVSRQNSAMRLGIRDSSVGYQSSRPDGVTINGMPYQYPSGVSWETISGVDLWSPQKIVIAPKVSVNPNRYSADVFYRTNSNEDILFTQNAPYRAYQITGDLKINKIKITSGEMIGHSMKVRINIYPNAKNIDLAPYKPALIDFPQLDIKDTPFSIGDGKFVIPPPTAIPIKTPEGLPVKPDGAGGWIDLDGNTVPVDEDTLIVEDLVPTPDEDGFITPGGDVIPTPFEPPTPPGGGVEPPPNQENEFQCKRDLRDIDFKPVKDAFTTSFPFSIPWDIERFIDNALGTIGEGERPEVALTFLGDDVVLRIPDFIHNWMPFARNLMIIAFDIGLVYLFLRWMKGGGN